MAEEKRGQLIVIDGIDGSGKTLQTNMLIERLGHKGYETATIDFPQYDANFFGALVGSYLRGEFGEAGEVSPYLASLPFACDRWESSPKIKAWLNDARIVIANRYVTANMGHQGGKIKDPEARREFIAWADTLEHEVFGIPRADLNILLQLNPKLAQSLVDKKAAGTRSYARGESRDIHERNIQHLRDTLECFLELAEQNQELWRVVDCNDSENNGILHPEIIHEKVWNHVYEFLTR